MVFYIEGDIMLYIVSRDGDRVCDRSSGCRFLEFSKY